MTDKVTSYMLLESNDYISISKQVNKALDEGWKLYGNPFSRENKLYQAIVR